MLAELKFFVLLYRMRSPVALFVYNRLDNTRQTIQHLLANTQARETELFVFSDGGRDEASWASVRRLREYLHAMKAEVEATDALKSVTLVERPQNIYLERNIMEGISQVLQEHSTIIVLEDDICTSPYYLQYMNQAFELYADVPRVMHVSGFTNLYLDASQCQGRDFYFTPHMSGWGWGTWRDRWTSFYRHYTSRDEALQGMSEADVDAMQYGGVFPCLRSLDKDPIPWDICWEMAIYKAHGLCLTPARTMVRNIGLKSGTHFQSWDILQHYEYDRPPSSLPLRLTRVEAPSADPDLEARFRLAIRDWGIRYTWLGTIVRFVYKRVWLPLRGKNSV